MGRIMEGLAGRGGGPVTNKKSPLLPKPGEARLITAEPVKRRGLTPLLSLSLSLSLSLAAKKGRAGPVTAIQGEEGMPV